MAIVSAPRRVFTSDQKAVYCTIRVAKSPSVSLLQIFVSMFFLFFRKRKDKANHFFAVSI
ncbi:MAG TPA: hypothetical protein DIC46_03805 [Porphyromonadaceae bacterium]|nr:hypothetical protein [Porphyromonadaceae bacterium]